MRLGLMMEGYVERGSTPARRLEEMVGQAVLAEEVGLDSFSVSEQHFKFHTNSVPQPDVILTAVARETSRIRLGAAVVVLPLYHPLHVAERIAMLDVFSGGRVDFGMGRGNTAATAEAFEVPMRESEARAIESVEVITRAWTEERFEHHGQYFSFNELAVTPRPLQRPTPPIYWAATSPGSHQRGGQVGYRLMTGGNAIDWGQCQRRIDRYHLGWSEGGHTGSPYIRINVHGFCAETQAEAEGAYGPYVVEYVNRTVTQYRTAVQKSGKQVDFAASERFQDNLPAVLNETPVAIGDPERCIEQLAVLAGMGVDEVTFRIDGPTDEEIQKCIRLLGSEVKPALDAMAVTTEAS